MNESLTTVVARFFNVPESALTDSFVLPPERLAGSISRRVLHAALKRLAGADLPGVWTATTFGELVNGGGAVSANGKSAPTLLVRSPVGASGKAAVGMDIEEIAKLPWSGDPWSDPFYSENFTDAERAYATRQPDPRTTLCGLWCAKEAVIKCGPEFAELRPKQIEIRHDADGRPQLTVDGASIAGEISISHSGAYATAVCVRYPAPGRGGDYGPPVGRVTLPRRDESHGGNFFGTTLPLLLSLAALALAIAAFVRR